MSFSLTQQPASVLKTINKAMAVAQGLADYLVGPGYFGKIHCLLCVAVLKHTTVKQQPHCVGGVGADKRVSAWPLMNWRVAAAMSAFCEPVLSSWQL